MLRIISLISLLGIIACGQQNDMINGSPMFSGVDPELQSDFQAFTSATGVSVGGISGGFVTLPGNIAGECVWGGSYNEVRISPDTWFSSNTSATQRQQLISHELGHCALHLYHINNCSDGTWAPDGTSSNCNYGTNGAFPLSIMNWQMFQQWQANNISTMPQYYRYLTLNAPIPWP